MPRRATIVAQVASLAVGARLALAACPGLHEIEDLMAAGVPPRTIQRIFEETRWAACLSEDDIERLRRAGLSEDLVALLQGRVRQATTRAEGEEIASAAVPREEEEVIYAPPAYAPYPYDPYPYPSPYTYGGFIAPFALGGGGLHHDHFITHHHHDHDWIAAHDPHDIGHHEAHHLGWGDLAHLGHQGALSVGHLEGHSVGHVAGHGHAGMGAHHGGFGGHGGHGGH